MRADQLLAHFDRISDAPDAVPRLRQFILDLAVRGKLIEQDSHDEPAKELLKTITAERFSTCSKGHKAGQIDYPDVPAAKLPFAVPTSWQWVRLIDLLTKLTDGTHHSPPNYPQGDFKYVTAKNIKPEGVAVQNITYVEASVHNDIYSRCNPEKGDLLYVKDGATTGVVTINNLDEPFSMLSSVALLKLANGIYNRLLVEFLRSPFFYEQMRSFMKGAAMSPALIPLPPLAEQRRIVAKVDELMALCDRLEAAQREREERRDRLNRASLHRLNNGDSLPLPPGEGRGEGASTFRDHARFHLRHLPRLTTRPEHIRDLRQTILNLAVRGKLVPQDPNDEPAATFLERIGSLTAEPPVNGAALRRSKKSLGNDDAPQPNIPGNWKVVTIGTLCKQVTSGSRGWAEFYSKTGASFIRAQNIRFGRLILCDLACVNPPKRTEGTRTRVSKGDLLIVATGAGVTNPALLEIDIGEAYVSQHVALVKPLEIEVSPWMLLCLMAPAGGRNELVRRAYGAGKPGLNLDNIRTLSIPFPPLAEQHRIVAKVDELMKLCDQLESQLTTTQTDSRRLLEALLHEALEPAIVASL